MTTSSLDGLSGGLTLPTRPGARFLCLTIAAGAYGELTPGTCAISGGPAEPFDLSRDHLFPSKMNYEHAL